MGVFSMEEIDKYIDSRIERLNREIDIFGKGDIRFITNRNIIIELRKVKAYIKSKRIKG